MKLRGRYNTDEQLAEFAEALLGFSSKIGFKVSSRGWAYLMEGERMINKDQFDKVTNLINTCRKKGLLPIDFVAEEDARMFHGVEEPDARSVYRRFMNLMEWALECDQDFNVNWWKGEDYYIQMLVEKVDLVTLFKPVCRQYKIPIANSKGWSSMLQRAEYARRFKEAEDNGLKCVLLYCGDHDPDGLRIGDFLRKNLEDLNEVSWNDGEWGYDPQELIIDRFGLNFDFIKKNKLTWIDNLITGSGRNLASPKHKNFKMPYVQDYLKTVGERKCEANAIVTIPQKAKNLCEEAIENYLGKDAAVRFSKKRDLVKAEFKKFKKAEDIEEKVNEIIDIAREYDI